MKSSIVKILALFMILPLALCSLPSAALAAGGAESEQFSLAPVKPIERHGDIVSSPVTSSHAASKRVSGRKFQARFLLDDTRLTSVKDQGQYGTCWAHAAMASTESILETHRLVNEPDLSEWQLVYYAYNSQNGLPAFDCTGGAPFDEGGNDDMAVAMFARGSSPVQESEAPYDGPTPPSTLSPSYSLKKSAVAHTASEWKTLLVDVGALSVGYYSDDDNYYNPRTSAYYCDEANDTNHAVTLVGWDDNYPASNFLSRPAGNGAWIIKNSWGAGYGNKGFFYLSYYDQSLDFRAYSYEVTPPAPGEKTYTYDDLGVCDKIGYPKSTAPETAAMKCVFTAGRGGEKLTSVGTYAVDDNASYSIRVNVRDAATGTFSPAWSSPQSGTIAMAGYTRIDLDTPVILADGQQYEVIVQFTIPGAKYPIPIETYVENYSSQVKTAPGQSYLSHNGTDWSDLADISCDVCLYAITVPAAATPRTVTFDSQGGSAVESATVNSGDKITEPTAPTCEGLVFGGWYRDTAYKSRWVFASDRMPDNDITLYAKWLSMHTVQFDSLGGSAVGSVSALTDSKISKPGNPAKAGYCFVGWYKEASCAHTWNFSTDTIAGDTTLYAKWIPQAQAITLAGLGLSAGSVKPGFSPAVKTYTVTLGKTVGTVTITPVKAYSGAAVTINGAAVAGKTFTVARGKSVKVTIKVTYGGKATTYTLTIKRQ